MPAIIRQDIRTSTYRHGITLSLIMAALEVSDVMIDMYVWHFFALVLAPSFLCAHFQGDDTQFVSCDCLLYCVRRAKANVVSGT
jgi:hypothetical protein